MAAKMLVATRTFMTTLDGKRVKVTEGKTRVRADHELVKGREDLFKDADTQFEDIEDTMDRPGRQRGSRPARDTSTAEKPAKKAAAKKAAEKPAESASKPDDSGDDSAKG